MAGRDSGPDSKRTAVRLPLLGMNLKEGLLLVKGGVPGWRGRAVVVVRWDKYHQQFRETQQRLAERDLETFLFYKKQRQ